MIVHVLTPVTRWRNLPEIQSSIDVAMSNAPEVELRWHRVLDLKHQHVVGAALRNQMLDEITDGWVWLLDDDTLVHEQVLARVRDHQEADAVVFSQIGLPNAFHPARAVRGNLWNGAKEVPAGGNVFDSGMAMVRRSLIGDWRLPRNRSADGFLFEEIIQPAENVVYLDEELCFYNALRPGKWGP